MVEWMMACRKYRRACSNEFEALVALLDRLHHFDTSSQVDSLVRVFGVFTFTRLFKFD